METLSSQAVATETAQLLVQPEMKKSPEQTVSDARKDCKKTLEKPRVTFDDLLNSLKLCMKKSSEGDLGVQDLEQLVADFSTLLTYTPLEKRNELSKSFEDFHSQLVKFVSESISDKKVSGVEERKVALKQFADGLHHKVSYYADVSTSKDSYVDSNGFAGCIGG